MVGWAGLVETKVISSLSRAAGTARIATAEVEVPLLRIPLIRLESESIRIETVQDETVAGISIPVILIEKGVAAVITVSSLKSTVKS